MQPIYKLGREKGVALGLAGDRLTERSGHVLRAAQRLSHQPIEIVNAQGGEGDRTEPRARFTRFARFTDLLEGQHQRMGWRYLVIPISPQQQQIAGLALGIEHLHQLQRSGIGPLEVVNENDEGMFLRRKDLNELLENEVEAILGGTSCEFGDGRLRADDSLKFGNDVDEDLASLPHRRQDARFPLLQLSVGFRQQLPRQVSEGLHKRAEGNVAIELVEFSFDEVTTLAHDGLVDFIHNGGFTNPRKTGDQHHLTAAISCTLKGIEQRLNFVVPPIELVGNVEAIANIPLPQLKLSNLPRFFPRLQTPLQIVLQPQRTLISILSIFCHQFQDDGREC